MNRRFRDVLDEKLNELRTGGAPSLSPYQAGSAEGDELADLLSVAAALRAMPAPQPSAAAIARGRQRLFAAMAETESRRGGLAGLWPSLRPVFAGAIAAVICLAFAFALNALGDRSLPGTAFYPVKTLKEQVQVWMATTPKEQAAVHLKMTKRRLNDLQNVTLRDGAPDLNVLAIMTREMDAALAALAQVPSTQAGPLLADLAAVARRQQSSLLWVQRRSPPEYQPVLAQAIVRAHETYQIALAAPTEGLSAERPLSALAIAAIVEFKGPVMGEDPDVLTVGSHQVVLSSMTQSESKPDLGSTVEVRAARLEDGRLIALTVRQTAPPVEGLWVRVNGSITGAYDSTWLINDRPVVFNAATNLVGWLQPGSTVEVNGLLRGDGTVLARDVQVQTTQSEVSLTGPVAERTAEQWVVAGMSVRISAGTYIDESQALAMDSQGASVRAVRQDDGSLVARSITTLVDQPAATVTLKDTVTDREGDNWTVGGWKIVADAQTRIVGGSDPVGRAAEVMAERLPDGTLLASRITVDSVAPARTVRIAFQGTAQWKDSALHIAGHAVEMDPDADIRADGRAMSELQPAPGRTIALEGWLLHDGSVVADTVRVLRVGILEELHGTIRELVPGHMILDNAIIYLDECVEVVAPGGAMKLGDLRQGQLVTVMAEPTEGGSFAAWKVQVGGTLPDKGPAPKPTNEPVPGGDKPAPSKPADIPMPSPTPTPAPTGHAKPKGGPGAPAPVTPTATPEPTDAPESTATVEPTATPTPWPTIVIKPKDNSPKPSPMPPTATPEPTATAAPTDTPEPTATPEPGETPLPGPGGPGGPPAPPTPPAPGPGGPGGPGEPPEPSPVPPAIPTIEPGLPRPMPTIEPPGKPKAIPVG